MLYKALGYAIWQLAKSELRRRYGGFVKPGAAAAVAVALVVVYVATRGDE
jgi:hypothetical protein